MGDEDNVYSDPEDGDDGFDEMIDNTNEEMIMKHKGNLPKEKSQERDPLLLKQETLTRNATQKYATVTDSPSKRKPKIRSGVYDIDVKKLEKTLAKLNRQKPKQNSSFIATSREQVIALQRKE